jgi:hypothetical protein
MPNAPDEPALNDAINALPERLRRYVAALETESDPSGTIRENFRLREENAGLRRECEQLAAEIARLKQSRAR